MPGFAPPCRPPNTDATHVAWRSNSPDAAARRNQSRVRKRFVARPNMAGLDIRNDGAAAGETRVVKTIGAEKAC